jgi:DNA-binding NarL/FixJ family response regulator
MKVVIADDSDLFRKLITSAVSDISGIEVIGQAADGPSTLQLITQHQPDIVIMDIRMPGGSGIEALRQIVKHEGLPIVIMLTNYPYPQYRKTCLEAGADYFFDKSKDYDEVLETIRNLLSNAQSS